MPSQNGANSRQRQMSLSMFLTGDGNYHMAGWRLPDARFDGGHSIECWIEAARIMERGKIDMMFIADGTAVDGADDLETLSYTSRIDRMDPIAILSAVSMVTTRLGLGATISTTFNEPFNIARIIASLDHICKGRAAWNIVTGANKNDALNYNHAEPVPHAERYDRAEEFVDVVRGLWDTYSDDAFPRDRASRYLDPTRVRVLNHNGRHFSVRGPLSVPRTPQGHPVLIQAGSSDAGMALSARVADIVFTSQSSREGAARFYTSIKERAAQFGRNPDTIKVLPSALLFIGPTNEAAREKYEELQSLIPLPLALQRLSNNLGGVDLSSFDLDGPLPHIPPNAVRVGGVASYLEIARREGLTLRETAMRSAAGKHHWPLIGSPGHIADQLEDWFSHGAADGFTILSSHVLGGVSDFVDLIVPILQKRGLFRTEYPGETLRDTLGLQAPQRSA